MAKKNKSGILGKMNPNGNKKTGNSSSFITKTAIGLAVVLFIYFSVHSVSRRPSPTQGNTSAQADAPIKSIEKLAKKRGTTAMAVNPLLNTEIIGTSFVNGDFQSEQIYPWHYLENLQWGGFSVEEETVTGMSDKNRFVRVDAHTTPPVATLKVFGAVQQWVTQDYIPEKLNFKMRVKNEQKLCTKQYAQAVVIYLKEDAEPNEKNLQLRIVIHGAETPPYNMRNARFHMNPEFTTDPKGWRNYSLPIHQWFQQGYPNVDPEHWKGGEIRLLIEARYDNLPKTTPPGTSILTVDYDDVFFSES